MNGVRLVVLAQMVEPIGTLARIGALFARHGILLESMRTIGTTSGVVEVWMVAICPRHVTERLLHDRIQRLIDIHDVTVGPVES